MADDSQVVITITGDPKQFKDALKQVSGGTDELKDHFVVTFGDMMELAKKFEEALMKPIEAFREQELAINSLNQAMVNAGTYTGDLADKYEKQAEELSKLTIFDKSQVIQTQATLQANIGAREVTEKLTMAVANLAAAKRIDLASAAEMVGKTISSETNLLKRQGIEFDNNTVGGARLAAVMGALNDKFGGQAEAAAKGLGGIQQLKNEINEIYVTLGKSFAPAVEVLVGNLKSLGEGAQKAGGFFEGLKTVLIESFKFIDDLGSVINNFVVYWSGAFGTLLGAASQAMSGHFKQAMTTLKDGFDQLDKEEQDRIKARDARQKAYDEAENAQIAQHEEDKTKMAAEAAAKRSEVVQKELDKVRIKGLTKLNDDLAEEASLIGANQQKIIANEIKALDKRIAAEGDYHKKAQLLRDKADKLRQLKQIAQQEEELKEYQATNNAKINVASGAAALLNTVGGDAAKAGFLLQQGAAVATTIVNSEAGKARAFLDFPYPVALGIAGSITASEYLSLATIAATTLKGFSDGGDVTGGIRGVDSVLGMLMPGELVVPERNYDEAVNAVASQRAADSSSGGNGPSGTVEVLVGFKDNAFEMLEAQQVRRDRLGISVRRV